tara:strand:- start:5981 stop:6400 length:420 start_codon:yes stop_codon:yes gene_type:complete
MKKEDSYFVFKLVSGEEIIATTTMDDSGVEPCFFIAEPLKVELTHKGTSTLVRLVPWITIPEDDEIYRLSFDKIITLKELDKDHEMVAAYEHYNLGRKSTTANRVEPTPKMGSLGNVDTARVSLEKIFAIDKPGISTTV